MDANQKELFDAVWNMVRDGHYVELIVYLAIIYVPAFIVWGLEWWKGHKIESLYKERIADKDSEIGRLAARVKEIENLTLKSKRK